MDAEYINENEIIAQLGIPRKKLRGLRPEGFKLDGQDGALWPLAAATALALSVGGELVPHEKTAPEIESLTVVSIRRGKDGRHFDNPNVLMAQRDGGEVVTVRVLHSAKYLPRLRVTGEPMTIKAKKSPAGNWWHLVGSEPRFPGQW